MTSDLKLLTGIIGENPSTYSKSPAMWNAAFKRLGIDAEYKAFDVPAAELTPFVQLLRAKPQLKGFNVTVPHKMAIVPLLDAIDPMAREIGAVNTVVRGADGKLTGYNTDTYGVLASLQPFFTSFAGLRVILLGAGGAARATAYALAEKAGAKGRVVIINRDPSKAKKLAGELQTKYRNAVSAGGSDLPSLLKDADVVINATTLGQTEPVSPLGKESAALVQSTPKTAVFFDLIYAPPETPFLKDAKAAGRRAINGERMIVAQAVEAFLKVMGQKKALQHEIFEEMSKACEM